MRTREEKNAAFGFTSGLVEVVLPHERLKIYYIEKGPPDAPVVLMLHGFGGTASNWLFNGPLSESFRIIALDLPGFGNSTNFIRDESAEIDTVTDTVCVFLERLGITEVKLVVGSSMGGVIGSHLAIRLGARCQNLALVATGGIGRRINPHTLVFNWLPRFMISPTTWSYIERRLAQQEKTPIRLFDDAVLGARLRVDAFDRPPAYDQEWVKSMKRVAEYGMDHFGQKKSLVALMQKDLKQLKCPILIVWGNRDRVISPKHGHILKEHVHRAKLVLLTECGHLPHIEKSEIFNRVVAYFLEQGVDNFDRAIQQENIFGYII